MFVKITGSTRETFDCIVNTWKPTIEEAHEVAKKSGSYAVPLVSLELSWGKPDEFAIKHYEWKTPQTTEPQSSGWTVWQGNRVVARRLSDEEMKKRAQ